MKKFLMVFLAFAMGLSLCACDGGKKAEDVVIGTWTAVKEVDFDNSWYAPGDMQEIVIELYKGGTGTMSYRNITTHEDGSKYSITWEVVDNNIMNITKTGTVSYVEGYEVNVEKVELVRLEDGLVFKK